MKVSIITMLASVVFSAWIISPPKNLLNQAERPGTVRTSEGGWTMVAKINGKAYKASSIYPPASSGRIVGYYKDGYIGLPYNKNDMVPGRKTNISTSDIADLTIPGESGTWGGNAGEMEIMKVSDTWVEGKFHFSATTYRNKGRVEVTEGFFRIKQN